MYRLQRVDDYLQYKESLRAYKKTHRGAVTNVFLPPDELMSAVAQKRLYLFEDMDNFCFLIDEGKYYSFYFYIFSETTVPLPCFSKPLICRYVYNRKNMPAAYGKVLVAMQGYGFCSLKKSAQIEFPLAGREEYYRQMCCETTDRLAQKGFVVSAAGEGDWNSVFHLWEQSLEYMDFPYMTQESLAEDVALRKCTVTVIRNSEGKAIAVYYESTRGRMSEALHMAVDPQYRGHGLGKALWLLWFVQVCGTVPTGIGWVNEGNEISLGIQMQYGMLSGVVSEQFIKD